MKFAIGSEQIEWSPKRLVIAGYTGKDQETVRKHIEELKEIGVPAPRQVPMLYDLAPELLSSAGQIRVVGNDSSGEAEVVLLDIDGTWYVGLGSDHTDRVLEANSVQKSKQVCAKAVSEELWPLDSFKDRWDEIEMRSWVVKDGETRLYQSGKLSAFLEPDRLLDIVKERGYFSPGICLYCGTLPLETEIVYGGTFKAELSDPGTGRKITLAYGTEPLKDAEVD
ncbi:DUF2848 family protein [Cohnella massiliensis]|uniref:DUF2848 family protein n=1 Tax=Cohnella massiliensis TaxID=1816691 RepID=UPI0009B9AC49|nr:DUF2848 family protein [Cohnella massiliensis]